VQDLRVFSLLVWSIEDLRVVLVRAYTLEALV